MPTSYAHQLVKHLRRRDIHVLADVPIYTMPRGVPAMLDLADRIESAPIYVADFGTYDSEQQYRHIKKLGPSFTREMRPARWAVDGPAILDMSLELARRGLLRLPHHRIFVEDFYDFEEESRLMFLAEELYDGDECVGVTWESFQRTLGIDGSVFWAWAPVRAGYLFNTPNLDARIQLHEAFDGQPSRELVRPLVFDASPVILNDFTAPGFVIKKLACLLATRGTIVERQSRVKRDRKSRRHSQPDFNVIRVPWEHEVTRTGEAAESAPDPNRPKRRRAHWVRGHIRGRHCWPESKWVWIPPHFRGVGEPSPRRPTLIKERENV